MHELSIAISIVDQVGVELSAKAAAVVRVVHLQLGRLSGVDKAALGFCYSAACEGTALEGSRLAIEEVPVTLYCAACGKHSDPPSLQRLTCPFCDKAAIVQHGYELEIARVELAA